MPRQVSPEELERLLQLIIPTEYLPDSQLENGKALLCVELISPARVPKTWTEDTLAALTDMGKLAAMADIRNLGLDGRYIIRIRDNLSYYLIGAALAHEVGHLVSKMEHSDNSERAAENWALERILHLPISTEERIKFLECILSGCG